MIVAKARKSDWQARIRLASVFLSKLTAMQFFIPGLVHVWYHTPEEPAKKVTIVERELGVVRAMVNPLYNEAVLLKHILEHDVDPAHVHISIYGEFMYNMGARLEVNPCQICTTSVDVAFYLSHPENATLASLYENPESKFYPWLAEYLIVAIGRAARPRFVMLCNSISATKDISQALIVYVPSKLRFYKLLFTTWKHSAEFNTKYKLEPITALKLSWLQGELDNVLAESAEKAGVELKLRETEAYMVSYSLESTREFLHSVYGSLEERAPRILLGLCEKLSTCSQQINTFSPF